MKTSKERNQMVLNCVPSITFQGLWWLYPYNKSHLTGTLDGFKITK